MRLCGAFPIVDSLVSGKWLVVRATWTKTGVGGEQVLGVYRVLLTINCQVRQVKFSASSFVAFPIC